MRQILRHAVHEERASSARLGSRIASRFADAGLSEPLPELKDEPVAPIWISSITLSEARYGLTLLADGQRKSLLQQRFDVLIELDLATRNTRHFDDLATPVINPWTGQEQAV